MTVVQIAQQRQQVCLTVSVFSIIKTVHWVNGEEKFGGLLFTQEQTVRHSRMCTVGDSKAAISLTFKTFETSFRGKSEEDEKTRKGRNGRAEHLGKVEVEEEERGRR